MAAESGEAAAHTAPSALQFAVHIPFVDLLGMRLTRFEDGVSEIQLELRPELCNSWAVGHGGAVMALLDVTMAHATRTPPKEGETVERHGVITIEMKTSFMRPAMGVVTGRGRLLHRTRSFAFCEADVINQAGELVAHATGTFKNRRPPAAASKEAP